MTSHWPEPQVPLLNHEISVHALLCTEPTEVLFLSSRYLTGISYLGRQPKCHPVAHDEVICLMSPTIKTNAEFQLRQQVPGPTLTPFLPFPSLWMPSRCTQGCSIFIQDVACAYLLLREACLDSLGGLPIHLRCDYGLATGL